MHPHAHARRTVQEEHAELRRAVGEVDGRRGQEDGPVLEQDATELVCDLVLGELKAFALDDGEEAENDHGEDGPGGRRAHGSEMRDTLARAYARALPKHGRARPETAKMRLSVPMGWGHRHATPRQRVKVHGMAQWSAPGGCARLDELVDSDLAERREGEGVGGGRQRAVQQEVEGVVPRSLRGTAAHLVRVSLYA